MPTLEILCHTFIRPEQKPQKIEVAAYQTIRNWVVAGVATVYTGYDKVEIVDREWSMDNRGYSYTVILDSGLAKNSAANEMLTVQWARGNPPAVKHEWFELYRHNDEKNVLSRLKKVALDDPTAVFRFRERLGRLAFFVGNERIANKEDEKIAQFGETHDAEERYAIWSLKEDTWRLRRNTYSSLSHIRQILKTGRTHWREWSGVHCIYDLRTHDTIAYYIDGKPATDEEVEEKVALRKAQAEREEQYIVPLTNISKLGLSILGYADVKSDNLTAISNRLNSLTSDLLAIAKAATKTEHQEKLLATADLVSQAVKVLQGDEDGTV